MSEYKLKTRKIGEKVVKAYEKGEPTADSDSNVDSEWVLLNALF